MSFCTFSDACSLPVEPGPCRKSLGRWYYNTFHLRCIHFAYGGCEGNANRFMSQEECMSQCGYRNGPPAPVRQVTERPVDERPISEQPAIRRQENNVRRTHSEGKKTFRSSILACYLQFHRWFL